MTSLTQLPAWHALAEHRDALAGTPIRALFERDAERAARFSLEAAGLFADYSKHPVVAETIARLTALARATGVEARRDAMEADPAWQAYRRQVVEADPLLDMRNQILKPVSFFKPKG